MDAEYGTAYATLYRRHWWWRSRERFLERALRTHVGGHTVGDILDFGCGDGLFFDVLARYGTPHGIEPHGEWLDPHGRWRSAISTAPLEPDPREAQRYGLIVALDVLEHLAHPEPTVAELARRLRPHGSMLITVPAFPLLWTAHDELNHHVRRYTRASLTTLLEGAGLRIVEARYFFVWPAVAKLLVRMKESVLGGAPRPPRIPWAPLNGLFYGACRLEQALLGSIAPPFGSSLFAVARLNTDAPPSP